MDGKEEVNPMMKKVLAAFLMLSFFGVVATGSDALAKRRCPPGQEDVNNICVPK